MRGSYIANICAEWVDIQMVSMVVISLFPVFIKQATEGYHKV